MKKPKPIPFFRSMHKQSEEQNRLTVKQSIKAIYALPRRNDDYSVKKVLLNSIWQGILWGGAIYFILMVNDVVKEGCLFFFTLGLLFGGAQAFMDEYWIMGFGLENLLVIFLVLLIFLPGIEVSGYFGWINLK